MSADTPSDLNTERTPIAQWYGARKHSAEDAGAARRPIPPAGEQGAGMKIAIQGEPGSFSHEAAMNLAADAVIVPCALSADVFAALASGSVAAAVIPIENSLAGSVSEHFDLLLTHDVIVEQETLLRIRHNLIAFPGAAMDEIDRVFSHPVALAQCRRFLAEHPGMQSCAFYDTAGSVKQLVELRDRHAAAIASEAAAQYYGAQILQAGIEDNPENFTRFFLVRRAGEAVADPESNKISIAFSVENRPGSLVSALAELSSLGTNLTKIESRPVHGKPWEYIFYVDCQIHSAEEGTRALDALRPHCSMVKELGRYREAVQP
jgi:prephenate dehydratase